MARPPQLTCGAIRFATISGSKGRNAARFPRGRRFGFAAIAMWAILVRSETPWAKSRFKFVILTRRSSEIQRMTLFG